MNTTKGTEMSTNELEHGAGYRNDPLPGQPGRGPFVIEGADHQMWVVDAPWLFRLGGGEATRLTDEAERAVGPWRYLAIPLPTDLIYSQANHAYPSTRDGARAGTTGEGAT